MRLFFSRRASLRSSSESPGVGLWPRFFGTFAACFAVILLVLVRDALMLTGADEFVALRFTALTLLAEDVGEVTRGIIAFSEPKFVTFVERDECDGVGASRAC